MNFNNKDLRASLQAAELRREFAAWLQSDADRLVSAAELLGGEVWETRALAVADAVACGAEPEEIAADLTALHRLLMLEFTDDIESHEAACFAMVHPDDPRADDARLCAEALERGLDAMCTYAALEVKEVA